MNPELKEIAHRMREMREVLSLQESDIAAQAGLSEEAYKKYEAGEQPIPISAIYAVAKAMEIDPTLLMTGEAPKNSRYTVTRNGKGVSVERYKEYSFSALAYNFKGRFMDPMIVELLPQENPPTMVTHTGQEFNYVLEGEMIVIYDGKELYLKAGDSIYFDPSAPHGQMTKASYAKFLTIIME